MAERKAESKEEDVLLLQPSKPSIYRKYSKALKAQNAVFKALTKLKKVHDREVQPILKQIQKDGDKQLAKARERRERRQPERAVVFLSHIPYGFFDDEMMAYFSQFGLVLRSRHVRSQRTGRSRGFGYVEFREPGVAKVVADVMNNYLTFGRIIKCQVMPKRSITNKLFRGGDTLTKHNCPALQRRKAAIKVLNGRRPGFKEVERMEQMTRMYEHKLRRLNKMGLGLSLDKIVGREPSPQEQNSKPLVLEVDASDDEIQFKTPPYAVKRMVWKTSLALSKSGQKRTATSPETTPKKPKLDKVENAPSTPLASEMSKKERSAKKKNLESPTKEMILQRKKLAGKKKKQYTANKKLLAKKRKLAKIENTPSTPLASKSPKMSAKKKKLPNTEKTPSTPLASGTPKLSAKKKKIAKTETTPSIPLVSETPKLSAKKKKIANTENNTPSTPLASETPKLSAKKMKLASIENTPTASETPKSAKKKKLATSTPMTSETAKLSAKKKKLAYIENTPSASLASETQKSAKKKKLATIEKTPSTPLASETPKSAKKKKIATIENTPLASETPKSAKKKKLANIENTPSTPLPSETPKSAKKKKLAIIENMPTTPLASETPKSAKKKKLAKIENTPSTPLASETPKSAKKKNTPSTAKKVISVKSPKNIKTPKKPTPKKMKSPKAK